jgi:PBP1b-binding outer membrane lipoprotein LpoB
MMLKAIAISSLTLAVISLAGCSNEEPPKTEVNITVEEKKEPEKEVKHFFGGDPSRRDTKIDDGQRYTIP